MPRSKGAVADPPQDEAKDDLLPAGEPEDTDAEALHRLASVEPPNVDAFVSDDAASDDDPSQRPAETYVRDVPVGTAAADIDLAPINLGFAQLQDVKISAARNGNNYDLTFEVGIEHLPVIARAAKGGHDVTWKKIGVGQGGELRRAAITRDADGGLHLKLFVHLPESEISRSLGRLGPNVRTSGELILEPMQGTLNMPGGKVVDLTARAR